MGMKAMLIFVMATQTILPTFVNGWYYEMPKNTLFVLARETVAGHNLGFVGLEDASAEISELASKVSSECLNNVFSSLPEMPSLYKQHQHMVQAMHSLTQQSQVTYFQHMVQAMHSLTQQSRVTYFSMESCLTSTENSEKNLVPIIQNAGKKILRTLQNINVPFLQTDTSTSLIVVSEDKYLSAPSAVCGRMACYNILSLKSISGISLLICCATILTLLG